MLKPDTALTLDTPNLLAAVLFNSATIYASSSEFSA